MIDSAQTTANNIRKAAATMAKGEYAFLIDYFDHRPFIYKTEPNAGKSFLAVAREVYQEQIRKGRLKDMPASVKNAGKGQQAGADGLTGPRT